MVHWSILEILRGGRKHPLYRKGVQAVWSSGENGSGALHCPTAKQRPHLVGGRELQSTFYGLFSSRRHAW
jgi:hypothetical protein